METGLNNKGNEPDDGSGGQGRAVAVLLLLVLVGAGWWLFSTLRSTAAIQDCVMAGRSNCAPMR